MSVERLRDTSEDLPSGSQLERVEHCKAALVLPRDARSSSEYAERGMVVHKFLEDCLALGGRDEALAMVEPEYAELCAAIDVDKLPAAAPGAYQAEMTFGWNPATGEVASWDKDPRLANAEVVREWMMFRADVVSLSKDKTTVYVGDYKTGYRAVPNAQRNLQVVGAAFVAAKVYGATDAVCEVIYVREGDSFHSRAELDMFALEEVESRLLALVKDIRDWRKVLSVERDRLPPQVLGPWCRYCPSFSYCPAQIRLINALGNHPMLLTAEIERHLSNGQAMVAAEKLFAAEMALKKVHEAIFDFASHIPITMADGQVLGEVTTTREFVKGPIVHEVMSNLFGIDVANEACEMKSSKSAIQRAVAPLKDGNKRTITGMVDETLKAVGDKDGIETKTSRTVKLHNPKRPALNE